MLSLNDLLVLAANRSDSWFDLWQLYFVITSTVLVVVSATPTPLSERTAKVLCGLIALAFLGFWTAFSAAYDARVAINSAITVVAADASPEYRRIAKEISLELGPYWCKEAWTVIYTLYSLVVLGLTWRIPTHRRQELGSDP